MKREVDFIAEFEKENAELKQEKTNPSPPTEEEYRKLWLSMKLVDLKKAQYQKTKNEQLWNPKLLFGAGRYLVLPLFRENR